MRTTQNENRILSLQGMLATAKHIFILNVSNKGAGSPAEHEMVEIDWSAVIICDA